MNQQEINRNADLIRNAYASFNARDIDSILAVLDPKVKWSRAWEGDYATGHEEVRDYWQRQWKEINPKVTPVGFSARDNGLFEVEVQQFVTDLDGNVLFDGKVRHVYVIDDGKLKQMDIEKF